MSSLRAVLDYSWPYLRRYWFRLAASILFGLIFALANASFIWAVKTLAGSFEQARPAPVQAAEVTSDATTLTSRVKEWRARLNALGQHVERVVDPWLPRSAQPLDWRQISGLLIFLPLLVGVRAGSDYMNSYCMGWVVERVIRDVRLALMTQLSRLSLSFFDHFKTGDLITRINMDTQNLLRSLRVGGADLIKESLTVVTVFVGLCLLDWKLTLSVIVLVPICLFP